MTEMSLQEAFQKAVEAHRSQRLDQAQALYEAILRAEPRHPDANHNLGVLAVAQGRPQAALPFLWAALEADLHYPLYWSSCIEALLRAGQPALAQQTLAEGRKLGLPPETVERLSALVAADAQPAEAPAPAQLDALVAALDAGDLAEAEVHARMLCRCFPQHTVGWKALGAVLRQTGRPEAAVEAFKAISLLEPYKAEAHLNLGAACTEAGHFPQAEHAYRQALSLNPEYVEAYSNLGATLKAMGRLPEAEAMAREAVRLKPDHAAAHNNLGIVLKELGRLEEAMVCYRDALTIDPRHAQACNNIGVLLAELGLIGEAEAQYRAAIQLEPEYAEAHLNLGFAMLEASRVAEAETAFLAALRINPNDVQVHSGLGQAWREMGRLEAAETSLRKAAQLAPRDAKAHFNAELLLPRILSSRQEMEACRARYASGLARLRQLNAVLERPEVGLLNSTFDLAYHGQDNRRMFAELSSLHRAHCPKLNFTAPHVSSWSAPRGRRVRVGICSQFLGLHTIGKLYRGLIEQLDRQRFEVVVIHASKARRDDFAQSINERADAVVHLAPGLERQQGAMADARLDILFYPDIGMSPETYLLAHARLAPVQVVSWGHPDTTGIDTVDYFVSSKLIEAQGADKLYAERLIQLSRLPCYYEAPEAVPDVSTRQDFGLPEQARLYGCPQSLFKLHPDFDRILAQIVEADPGGYIVLLHGRDHHWANVLQARWRSTCPILCERVLFLPRQTPERFLALMAHFDVLLDPIHFGSGNTMYEAQLSGTPIVTWPGEFMRGRIVVGAYAQMRLTDAPVVTRLEDYAAVAVAWAQDENRRAAFKKCSIEAARKYLFSDHGAVRELEVFFEAALGAALQGGLLAPSWSPQDTGPNPTEKIKRSAGGKGAKHQAQLLKKPIKLPRPSAEPALAEQNAVVEAFGARRFAEAENAARRLTQEYPRHTFGWKALGVVLQQVDKTAAAVEALTVALKVDPVDAGLHLNMGAALKKLGRFLEAEQRYREALRLRPDYAEAYGNLGAVLKDVGKLAEAEACLRKAIQLKPQYAAAFCNLGVVLDLMGRLEEATQSCRDAIAIDPHCAEAFVNLGSVLLSRGNADEAEWALGKAISLNTNSAEAHGTLGNALRELGRIEEAERSLREAAQLAPSDARRHFNAELLLPRIAASREELAVYRDKYARGIAALQQSNVDFGGQSLGLSPSTFELAYQGKNDKEMMVGVSGLYRARFPNINFTAPHLSRWAVPEARKVRVGLCSQFLRMHTIGKLYQGLVEHLSRDRFELVIIHAPRAQNDLFAQQLHAQADQVLHLCGSLEQQQRAVAEARLDVLFYPDIGMCSETYLLAHARLAPVQAVSWGHPDTTGIDTIDYFISADSIESSEADAHYSERLIRFSRLPCCFAPLKPADNALTRQDFGLPENARLYGCPQSLFKLHPDFDAILAQIVENDEEGYIVLLEGWIKQWADALMARWSRSHPILCERVLFIPRQTQERFLALLSHFDVLLDPIHFGSGNTMYEAQVSGTPIVTWPGEFMRGRIVAGAYAQMGLTDAPVVARRENYAQVAVAWAKDQARREAFMVESRMAAQRHLYSDLGAVREFEEFFEAALRAVGERTLLGPEWKCADCVEG